MQWRRRVAYEQSRKYGAAVRGELYFRDPAYTTAEHRFLVIPRFGCDLYSFHLRLLSAITAGHLHAARWSVSNSGILTRLEGPHIR